MNIATFLGAALLLGLPGAIGQQPAPDKRLMSGADYKTFLVAVDAQMSKWEATFTQLDLEKVPRLTYAQGKSIADEKDLGLREIGYIRDYVTRQQRKRTVAGELALKGFLESLFSTGEEILWEEDFSGLTLTNIDKLGPALSPLMIQISNDVLARVDLLEKGSCPSSPASGQGAD